MPRNVRNFWVDLRVDGKEQDVGTGPRSKDGGFGMNISIRDKGSVSRSLVIDGWVLSDGRLRLQVTNLRTSEQMAIETER